MGLLERVTTLVKANLNDLIDRAEDPEKVIKQVILDMQNQLIQVKTQVAMSVADQYVLAGHRKEHEDKAAEWMRKAELALDRKQESLARAALERCASHRRMAENFDQQAADQHAHVEHLKSALRKLEQKLAEAEAASELVIARHRRARASGRATEARLRLQEQTRSATLDRMRRKALRAEAASQAGAEMIAEDSVDDRLAALERDDMVDRLLAELKARRAEPA